ncbi:hypothetical protein P691DRAFT_651795, partial [Macrolepiota fuliginosa MF-IS2]
RYIQNSPKADSATIWIDLSDSQQGTRASLLIGRRLIVNGAEVLIKGAKAHTGTPQCCRCWKWGHTTDMCRRPAVCCPICIGPHTEANHRSIAGAHSMRPPCPHSRACINCGAQHAANSRRCPYWHHRFNRTWLKER